MREGSPEPSDADGPLIKAALDQASEVDQVGPGMKRRKAVARLVPLFLAAIAENWLRTEIALGAGLISGLAIVIGALSGDMAWGTALIVVGIAGAVMTFLPMSRSWRLRWHWTTYFAIYAAAIGMLIAFWNAN
jgi:hypothetical protein